MRSCSASSAIGSPAAQIADRHVQGDAVHPGGKAPTRVVAGKCPPLVRGDFLRQVVAVLAAAAIAGRHFQHDAAMLLQQGAEAGLQVCVQGHGSGRAGKGEFACRMIRAGGRFLTT